MPVNINGKIYDEKNALISVFDHGFLFGDSVYETIRTYFKKPFLINKHLKRMRNSASAIEIPVPWDDDFIEKEINNTINIIEADEYYIRLIITRGESEIVYAPNAAQKPNFIIISNPYKPFPDEWYEQGIKLITSKLMRNPISALNPANKTSNLLNSRLAYMEAYKFGAKEAILLNMDGFVTECSTSNIFFVKNNEILTPALSEGLLPGITRELVIDLAQKAGIKIWESQIKLEEAYGADECFITSTLKNIMPVSIIDEITIPHPVPGEKTLELMNLLNKYIEQEGIE